MVVGETSAQNTGSSLYSRTGMIHICTSCSRISRGSTRSSRSRSHSCRTCACSRSVPNGRSCASVGADASVSARTDARERIRHMVANFAKGQDGFAACAAV